MKINNEKIVKRGFAKFGTLLWGDCQKNWLVFLVSSNSRETCQCTKMT